MLDGLGLKRSPLSDLAGPDGINAEGARQLLAAMQRHSKPVKAQRLGVIGKDHLRRRFEAAGCQPESFTYKARSGETDGLPWVQETAFGYCPQVKVRRFVTGVNWSPGILNPFRELGKFGQSLDGVLERLRVGKGEPVIVLLHVACPRVAYTDRGKSAVVVTGDAADDEGEES